MKTQLQALLRKFPSLRKLWSFWYQHTNSTALFSPERGVIVLDKLALSDKQQMNFAQKQTLFPERCSTLPHVSVLCGADVDFSSRKVALLAHLDQDARIDPYVVHYARHLSSNGFSVVLCSASPLEPSAVPASKLPFAAILSRSCPGYDFTSWKAALEALPSLWNAAELFLTNDSIFAPVGTFSPVFERMATVPCDFWGLVECHNGLPYLQTYAMLLCKRALQSEALRVFFEHVPCDGSRELALALEQLLTVSLVQQGLSAGAWLPASALPWPWFNPLHRTWKQLPALGVPFMKRDMFLGRPGTHFPEQWREVAAIHSYPTSLIENYLQRVR